MPARKGSSLSIPYLRLLKYLPFVAAIGYLSVVNMKLKHEKFVADAIRDMAITEAAKREAFIQWKAENDLIKGLSDKLQKAVAALKATDKGVKAVEAHETKVSISDTAKGTVGPESVEDEYGRFRFNLKTGDLTRKQKFQVSSVIARSPDGKYRFEKQDFREFSPKSGAEIPTEGAEVKGDYKFVDEAAPAVKAFHPRLVAAIDYRGAVGAGVELLNLKDKANLSVIGLYDRSTKKADVAVQLGYRLRFPFLDTSLSVGPNYSLKGGLGAGLVLEVTR